MKKLILKIIAVLVILAVIASVVVYLKIGGLIKTGIETVGPKVTQCPVTIEDLQVSPIRGKIMIKNLVLGNPDGFSTDTAFKLGTVEVEMVPKSLFSDKIIIKKVLVSGPEVTYEITPKGTNIGRIQKNVEEFTKQFSSGEEEEKEEPEDTEVSEAKKMQIDDLLIKEGKITFAASIAGFGGGAPIPLPEIHKTDIGKEEEANTYEVVAGILKEVLGSVLDIGKKTFDVLKVGLKELGNASGDVGNEIKNLTKDAGKEISEGAKSLLKGIKSPFSKDED